MITIRRYEESDAQSAGQLIADTFSDFNLSFASPAQRDRFLGPFRYARSVDKNHQEAIARVIRSEMVFVAEVNMELAGILRGRTGRLASLFVRGDYHRQGIGRMLVSRFEEECVGKGVTEVKVAATLYAVPFYLRMGYTRTTGVRSGSSFDGRGLPYQPMKKDLSSTIKGMPDDKRGRIR